MSRQPRKRLPKASVPGAPRSPRAALAVSTARNLSQGCSGQPGSLVLLLPGDTCGSPCPGTELTLWSERGPWLCSQFHEGHVLDGHTSVTASESTWAGGVPPSAPRSVAPMERSTPGPRPLAPHPSAHQGTAALRTIFGPVLCQPLFLFVQWLGLENHFFEFERGVAVQPPFLKEKPSFSLSRPPPGSSPPTLHLPSHSRRGRCRATTADTLLRCTFLTRSNALPLSTSCISPRLSPPTLDEPPSPSALPRGLPATLPVSGG